MDFVGSFSNIYTFAAQLWRKTSGRSPQKLVGWIPDREPQVSVAKMHTGTPLSCSRREPENASKRQPSTVQALSKHPTFLSKHPRNRLQKPGFYCPSFATEWPFYNIKFRNSDLTHAWERATHPACDVKSRILPRERFDAFL